MGISWRSSGVMWNSFDASIPQQGSLSTAIKAALQDLAPSMVSVVMVMVYFSCSWFSSQDARKNNQSGFSITQWINF